MRAASGFNDKKWGERMVAKLSGTWTDWKMVSGAVTPFFLAASLSTASASSTLPWDSSHRGDSGMSLRHNELGVRDGLAWVARLVNIKA